MATLCFLHLVGVALRKLGVATKQSKMVVSSRKGYWKLSRTLATNMGMGNAWLEGQGLISLKEQWVKIHYPASLRR